MNHEIPGDLGREKGIAPNSKKPHQDFLVGLFI
jgi:hypothetical protein